MSFLKKALFPVVPVIRPTTKKNRYAKGARKQLEQQTKLLREQNKLMKQQARAERQARKS
jgi:hypothetical protein